MKQFAVIGDPISHSLSPVLHREIYSQLGIEASYDALQVNKDGLESFLAHYNLDGINITIPHKESVIPHLDGLDKSAEIIGAVNCVSNGTGFNTDWVGFLRAMTLNQVDLTGKDCAILGAGGAARAVAYALMKSKAASITIVNRTKEKADHLVQWINDREEIKVKTFTPEGLNTLTHKHIIINCTPLGMWPNVNVFPMEKKFIHKNQTLIDTIYNPLETAWLKKGKALGTKFVGGLDMFIEQGLASADIWFGEKISEKIELEPLKKVLKSELC